MKAIEKTGKTVDEAIASALAELHLDKEAVTIEVLTKGSRGILGFGVKEAKVRITYDQEYEPIKEISVSESSKDINSKESIISDKDIVTKKFISSNKDITTKDFNISNNDAINIESVVSDNTEIIQSSYEDIDIVEQKAIHFLQNFLQEIKIEGEIKITKKSASFIGICLEGEKMGTLIGRKGETLDAIQYLVNVIANKGRQQYIKILVDTENYRAKREQSLKDLVAEMSQRVKQSHKPVVLEPMNPYDRRIVHSTLQEDPLVKTYSEGKDPFRKVIIIPSDL